ncbi:FAD-binding oxidoreductase [Clostridium isatidis]|uniref:FAD-binding oxidoreductase n=1 Tax=Clostridium isatidis TaxID=182773 RepID=UPI00181EBF50|nr:FAD-binding oxidoreductase [Clostridiales bacterium]
MMNINFDEISGEVITRSNKKYDEAKLSWNRAIDVNPLIIINCYNEIDVINAIKFVKKNYLEFRIRSGRHSYEGYSTGENLVVIDVSNLKEISIDEDKGIVKLGGGVRNREAYEALGAKGYPFPGGGCPTVGVAGLILGGGWGYSSRYLGLACDSLLEIEMIDYKGNKLILNENINRDLFWACRGAGGGNYGVVVSLTLKLPEKVDMGTLIRINYKNINEEDAVKILENLQNLYRNLDYKMNLKTSLYNSKEDGIGIKLIGLFYGEDSEARKILKSITEVSEKIEADFDYMTILECNRWIQDSHPEYESYKSGGRFLYKELDAKDIRSLLDIIKERAKGSYYTAITLYGLGGKVKEISKAQTAFYYRDAKFILGFQTVWEDNKYKNNNKDWFLARYNIITELTEGAFVNFPLHELKNYEEEYFGANLKRLKEIKEKYDPNNFFIFPQVINGTNELLSDNTNKR